MSFLRREPATPPSTKRGKKAAAGEGLETLQRLRLQARRRLLGAAVLVGIGIVAFPLVFETQPRPVPMDLPIVIPAKEGATPAVAPQQAALPASLPEDAEMQAADAAPLPEPASPPARSSEPLPQLVKPKAEAKPKVLAEAPRQAASAAAPASARFVVQVGAFADKQAAQAARKKLEGKGLKTYAQVAKTPQGERIRVRLGPFATRADADKAASQAKAAGLAGAVLTL